MVRRATIPMPPTSRQRQGRWAEQRALRLLEGQGWRLVARNWRCRWGELDLVCEKPGRLLLVEVKGRRPGHRDGAGCGGPFSLPRFGLQSCDCLRYIAGSAAAGLVPGPAPRPC